MDRGKGDAEDMEEARQSAMIVHEKLYRDAAQGRFIPVYGGKDGLIAEERS
jgi:hypothetical protein